jgi:hypothetical protein
MQRIYSYKLYLQLNVRTATSVGDFESGGTLTGWKSIFKAFDTGVAIIFCKKKYHQICVNYIITSNKTTFNA